jgi:hypothetical protein
MDNYNSDKSIISQKYIWFYARNQVQDKIEAVAER